MARLLWLLVCGTVDERLEEAGADAMRNHSGVIVGLSMKMEEGWMFVKMRGASNGQQPPTSCYMQMQPGH